MCVWGGRGGVKWNNNLVFVIPTVVQPISISLLYIHQKLQDNAKIMITKQPHDTVKAVSAPLRVYSVVMKGDLSNKQLHFIPRSFQAWHFDLNLLFSINNCAFPSFFCFKIWSFSQPSLYCTLFSRVSALVSSRKSSFSWESYTSSLVVFPPLRFLGTWVRSTLLVFGYNSCIFLHSSEAVCRNSSPKCCRRSILLHILDEWFLWLKIKQDFIPFKNTPLIGQLKCWLIIYYRNSIKTFDRPNFAGG